MPTSASVPGSNCWNPLLALPNELLWHISGLLSLNELFKAALVCRRWRNFLLDSPGLWTRIRMSFGEATVPQPSQFQCALDCVLSRSARLPIDLAIHFYDDVNWQDDALSGVRELVRANMDRVKCLSLVAPSWLQAAPEYSDDSADESETMPVFLLQNAPILECFRLRIESGRFPLADSGPLFAHLAPRLRELEFADYMRMMPRADSLFREVTTFTLDWPLSYGDHLRVDVIESILARLPSLQRLTLIAIAIEEPETPFGTSLELLQVSGGDWDAHRFFPNARDIVYSFHYAEPTSGTRHLAKILRAQNEITTLDLHLVLGCVDSSIATIALTVNGRLLVTDMQLTRLDPFAETIASTVPLEKVATLVLPEGTVWELIERAEMPSLRELTVHIQRPRKGHPFKVLCDTSGPRWAAVSVLRVARLRIYETDDWMGERPEPVALPAKLLAEFIAGRLDSSRLTKVVLRGWELLPCHDCGLPGHVTVVHEDEIACEDWEPLEPWIDPVFVSEGLQL